MMLSSETSLFHSSLQTTFLSLFLKRQHQMYYKHFKLNEIMIICINEDMIKVKLPEDEADSFPPSSLFVSIVAFFFLSEESTTLARVGDSSVITMSSLCQCIVSILAKHLARSWPETLSFTLVRWRKCFGFRGRVNTDFEVCSLVSLSVITSCFATECFSIYEKFTNWLWTYLSNSYLSYYYKKSKKVIVELPAFHWWTRWGLLPETCCSHNRSCPMYLQPDILA